MQQYEGPVELIIANDDSPDATDEVVKKYFSENPAPENFEIKYTKHDTNKGMMPYFIWDWNRQPESTSRSAKVMIIGQIL